MSPADLSSWPFSKRARWRYDVNTIVPWPGVRIDLPQPSSGQSESRNVRNRFTFWEMQDYRTNNKERG
jgi:hypothetical protein